MLEFETDQRYKKGEAVTLAIMILLSLPPGILYASIFEWGFHRYVMHKPLQLWKWKWELSFRYPFEAHALTHHKIFKADHTYHLQEGGPAPKIRMAFWNIPFIVLMGMFPFIVAAIPFVVYGWWAGSIAISITGLILAVVYYIAYEYIHWCMHLPKNRRLEQSWIFQRLNAHHLLHHRYMGSNFNVVLPLADWLFGTLITEAKFSFKQPEHPSVPNVQPRLAAA